MAKKKNDPKATPEVVAVKVTPVVEKSLDEQMSDIRNDVDQLVKDYNESAEFGEFKVMMSISEKIVEKLESYAKLAETKRFNELELTDNPMLEIAKNPTYAVITVKDKQHDYDKGSDRVVDTVNKAIDPLRLHKRVLSKTKGDHGIGKDAMWPYMVENLNVLMTCAAALRLNLNPKAVRASIAMSEATEKLGGKSADDLNNDDLMLEDVQACVDAMLGEGYTVDAASVKFLRAAHIKASNRHMELVCATHKTMRHGMVSVLRHLVTGEDFSLKYKQANK